MTATRIAVGVGHRFVGDGWDPAPLLLALAVLVLLRLARVRLGLASLGVALIGGVLIDLITDVLSVSPATVIAVFTLLIAVVSLVRTPAR